MAKVVLTRELGRTFADGELEFTIDCRSVRDLIRQLDARFPGIGEQLMAGMSVAIDGEIHEDAYLESLEAGSEVYFLPALGGG